MACVCGSNRVVEKNSGPHIGEYCADCGKWQRWVPVPWKDFIWPIGQKHKGKRLEDILETDRRYLEWAAESISSPGLKKKAQEALDMAIQPAAKQSSPKPRMATKPSKTFTVQTDLLDDLPPW